MALLSGTNHKFYRFIPDHTQADQGAASSGTNLTVYDIVQTVGTSKYALVHFTHNPDSGNTTEYNFDTSLDLSSYPYLYFQIDSGVRFTRTTGDETFKMYSTDNMFISEVQQITSVDMIRFYQSSGMVSAGWFGIAKNNSTDDAAAINLAISCANQCGATLYFPGGQYALSNNTLANITVSVYGPEAEFRGLTTNDTFIIRVDYAGKGKSFVCRAIFGVNYPGSHTTQGNRYGAGLEVIRADHSTFDIGLLEGLDTAISFNSNYNNYHIAQCTTRIQSILWCDVAINCTGGTSIQCEANNFYVQYIGTPDIGIYLSNAGGYCVNNHFEINAMELHGLSNLTGVWLTGTTPANTTKNTFIFRDSVSNPTGTGKIIHATDAGIINNYFKSCHMDFSLVDTGGPNVFDLTTAEINNPGSATINARSQLYSSAAPTSGYWQVGDICWNKSAAVGSANGWVCTAAGSPGTWIALGQTGYNRKIFSFTTPNDTSGTWQDSGTNVDVTVSKIRGIEGAVSDGSNMIPIGSGQVSTSERWTLYISSDGSIFVANNTVGFANKSAYIVVTYID